MIHKIKINFLCVNGDFTIFNVGAETQLTAVTKNITLQSGVVEEIEAESIGGRF
jgi:hypothetical protein